MQETILILDFGSQYTQLIARRLRELHVYCEIHPYNHSLEINSDIKGVILSGSPCSVSEEDAPIPNWDLFGLSVPVLGICYGAQLIARQSGGKVEPSAIREYGRARMQKSADHSLLHLLDNDTQVWMSHADSITFLPDEWNIIAHTQTIPVAAFSHQEKQIFGIQFHPEVTHSLQGKQLLHNFVFEICGCKGDWTPAHFVESSIEEIKQLIGTDKVVMGLSGGVDSTVAATLIHKAIGEQLYCIFVNNGLLRKNEYDEVLEGYKVLGLNIIGVDASHRFLEALDGISEPEQKRKIIGGMFIEVFDEEAHKLTDVSWLGQGTIYPDVIESVSLKGPSATIKSHHNVGGLPDKMKLKLVEPLRMLFKDEVRAIGYELNLPEQFIGRHPFPGPGLAIRVIDSITPEKVRILQDADHIFIKGLKEHGLYDKVWQAGAIYLPVKSVGVMGDERTYENVICLRAVTSVDGMTADWSDLPHEFLAEISSAIINNVKGINRVVYDISSKPPSTIEWE